MMIDVHNFTRCWWWVLLVFAALVMPAVGFAQEGPSAGTETESLKKAILSWSSSLVSFSGTYNLSQLAQEQQNQSAIDWRVILRWDGRNSYLEMETLSGTRPDNDIEIYSLYNGALDIFTRKNGHPYGVANAENREALPFPWGVFITPEEIFGHHYEYTLADVLGSGVSRVVERDGLRILSHVNPTLSRAVDISVDSDGHVTRIEWVRRPHTYSEEAIKGIWSGDPFDLRRKKTSLEFADFWEIDGIAFPAEVVKTWWAIDEVTVEKANTRYEAGQIDQDELTIALYTAPVYEFNVQFLVLEHARLNVPLSEEDFRIDWPDGLNVLDARYAPGPGEIVRPPRSPYVHIVAAAGALLVLGAVTAVIMRRRNPRKAHRAGNRR